MNIHLDSDAVERAFVAVAGDVDRPAAAALADAMEHWSPEQRAAYRNLIAHELERQGGAPVDSLLAMEVLALVWADGPAD